ncbi:MAG: hypothetical protein EKK29_22255 [Hyphomicrobiales bacterium]|nr:MAG: hypothetical protein EKK29_22255 [Hyphomicrobiales bacterium]
MRVLLLLAPLCASPLIASVATAAETRAPRPPMFIAPEPAPAWSGLYVGLGAGLSFAERKTATSFYQNAAPQFASVPTGVFAGFSTIGATGWKPPATNFSAGAQFGYNYKVNERLVLGVEADIQGARF